MNVSIVPVKIGIGDATTTVSYETATPTTYSTTADIKNNHTGIPPLSSETIVRNKTSKAILPVTSSTILDKELLQLKRIVLPYRKLRLVIIPCYLLH